MRAVDRAIQGAHLLLRHRLRLDERAPRLEVRFAVKVGRLNVATPELVRRLKHDAVGGNLVVLRKPHHVAHAQRARTRRNARRTLAHHVLPRVGETVGTTPAKVIDEVLGH